MKRRIVIAALALLLLAGGTLLVRTALGLPPPKYYLRYGLSPRCAATGESREVAGHVFVRISPGISRMGSARGGGGDALGRVCSRLGLPWGDQPKTTDEMPVHWVEFPEGFWIAAHEVTNAQFERFDPDYVRSECSPGDHHPAVNVSWLSAQKYCAWLEERTGVPVRLPSEAEWECACRAGSETEYCFGDDEERLAEYAWHRPNAPDGTRPVGGLKPNAWGLFDLHGNVGEWCEDTVHETYAGAPADGSAWIAGGSPFRIFRGGSWGDPAGDCRSAFRFGFHPAGRLFDMGFRPAFSPREE